MQEGDEEMNQVRLVTLFVGTVDVGWKFLSDLNPTWFLVDFSTSACFHHLGLPISPHLPFNSAMYSIPTVCFSSPPIQHNNATSIFSTTTTLQLDTTRSMSPTRVSTFCKSTALQPMMFRSSKTPATTLSNRLPMLQPANFVKSRAFPKPKCRN